MTDLQKIQSMREIWFHCHLTHPNIIALYAAWIEDGKICLAMEFAPIGSAFRKLRKSGSLPEDVSAKYIVFQMLCALMFLHELGLIHRDIKPENILLTSNGCKLADLGLVINHKEETANTCLGTFDYMVASAPSAACGRLAWMLHWNGLVVQSPCKYGSPMLQLLMLERRQMCVTEGRQIPPAIPTYSLGADLLRFVGWL
jgi:serine/threonine protein kinase